MLARIIPNVIIIVIERYTYMRIILHMLIYHELYKQQRAYPDGITTAPPAGIAHTVYRSSKGL